MAAKLLREIARYRYTCNYPANCRGGEHYDGACFEGQAAIDSCSVDLCAATSMGPLCGKCKWAQQSRSYMKNEKCLRCQGGETALVVSILVLLVALPTAASLVLWRFTRARALTCVTHSHARVITARRARKQEMSHC